MEVTHFTEMNGTMEGKGININIDNRPVDVCFYGEFNLMQLLYFREELIEGLASIEEEIKKRQDIASN